ncbi:MAG TPA: ATP-binding protein, partial [Aquabacterium sp.]|nr:ATP-binding protein [Aquabacterium sp.]
TYPDFPSLFLAGQHGDVRVVCAPDLTSTYYLNLMGVAKEFRQSAPLVESRPRWAVLKSRPGLQSLVATGFEQVGPQALRSLEDKWLGNRISADLLSTWTRDFLYLITILLGILGLLVLWLRATRLAVARKTMALNQERMRLETLFRILPDATWLIDPDGKITLCNRAYEELVGKPANQILGYTEAEALGPKLADVFSHPDQNAFAPGADAVLVEQHVTMPSASGARMLDIVRAPLRGDDGSLQGIVGVASDVTALRNNARALARYNVELESRVAERTGTLAMTMESLRHANSQLQAIFDTASTGILLIRDCKIESCNKRGQELTSRGLNELIGHAPQALGLTVPDWPQLIKDVHDCMAQGQTFERELELLQKDGQRIWVRNWARALDSEDESTGIVVLMADVTEERATLSALIKARESAEAADRAKSEFLANISHEIRTPLNGVIGLTHLLMRKASDPDQLDKLSKISASGEHLMSVINDVLDFSKIESRQLELEDREFELAPMVRHILSIIEVPAKSKPLELRYEIIDAPAVVRGDVTRLTQAFLNLANNAVKFTHQGEVTLRILLEQETQQDVLLRFEVIDTGIGIHPEAMKRLFTAFTQADASTTRQFGGTGLGLVITRRLAQLMGGDAGAHSLPGDGSTFWFTARLRKAKPAGAARATGSTFEQAEDALRNRFAGERVLLAEDNRVNQEVAAAMLEEVGLVVDVAADGAQAVEMASGQRYAAILMDMQMPRLDGPQATRQIRQLPGYSNTPIIGMSANAFIEDRRDCLAAGMDDFMTKPVAPKSFYATLASWMKRHAERADPTAPQAPQP